VALLRLLSFLVLLALAGGGPARAGDDAGTAYGEWHTGRKLIWSARQYLNALNDMAIGNDGHAYVAADNGTLFVTDDRGEHWREEHVPINGILHKVYANDAGAVLVVRNAGENGGDYAWSLDYARPNTWLTGSLEPEQKVSEVGFVPTATNVIWMLLLTDHSEQRKPGKLVLRTTADGGR